MADIRRPRYSSKKTPSALALSLFAALTLTSGKHLFDAHAAPYSPPFAANHTPPPTATAMQPPPVSVALPSAVVAPMAVPSRPPVSDPQILGEALQEAARTGNAAQIRSLFRQGAVLGVVDESNRTPLMLAVIFNQPVAVKQLLVLGASRTAKDTEGLTALMHARKLGLPRLARLLSKR